MNPQVTGSTHWPSILLWSVVTLVLLVFAALAVFARPITDDYCVVYQSASVDFLEAQRYWYLNWMGRFTAAGAYTLFARLHLAPQYYGLAPLSMLLGLAAGFWLVARAVLATATAGRQFAAAALLLAVYLVAVPAPDQSLYWMTGAYTYQLGNVLALFVLALLLARAAGTGNRRTAALAVVLAVLAAGANETLMVAMVAAAVAAVACGAWWQGRADVYRMVFAAAVMAAALVVYFAPGNAVRGAAFSGSHHLVASVTGALASTVEHVLRWSLSLPLLGLSLMSLAIVSPLQKLVPPERRGTAVLCWLLLILLCFVPAYWAMGHRPPARARVPIHLVFIAGWFLLLLPWLWQRLRSRLARYDAKRLQQTGAALLVIGLLVQGNLPQALYDLLSGDALRYAAAQDLRDAVLARGQAADEFALASLPVRPPTLLHEDVTADPQDWRNRCLAQYYGIGSVRVVDKD